MIQKTNLFDPFLSSYEEDNGMLFVKINDTSPSVED